MTFLTGAHTWLDSGYMSCFSTPGFRTNFPFFYVDVDSDLEVFFLRSHAEWRSVLSRCLRSWLMHAQSALESGVSVSLKWMTAGRMTGRG